MNPALVKRVLIFVSALVAIIVIFFAVNLFRFSPERWLAERFPTEVASQLQGQVVSHRWGTQLSWEKPELSWQSQLFSADTLDVQFNLLSVAIGKPNLQQVTVASPYIQLTSDFLDIQQLRPLIRLGFQQLELTDGLLVTGDTEVQNIELSMLKNGVFGEYAAQLSAEFLHAKNSLRLGYSTLIGIDGENKLVFGKNQFDARIQYQQWRGRLAGKIKSAFITEDQDIELKFVNWSSNWTSESDTDVYPFDWAGGMSQGSRTDNEWTFSTFDTAVAYHDADQVAHTFALQSNETRWVKGDLIGQLGLSLLTEYPNNPLYQSYNLVMSGEMLAGHSIFDWYNPDIRLSMIDQDNNRDTHFFKSRIAQLNPSVQQVQLVDGEWLLERSHTKLGDFGFTQLTGDWPTLQVTDTPALANKIQPALTLIAPDVEYLDALFTRLVP